MLCCCQTIKVYYYYYSDGNGSIGGIKAFKSIVDCASFIRICQKKGWDYEAWIIRGHNDAEQLEATFRIAPIRL